MSKFDPGMESMLDTFMFETSELLESLDEILMRTEKDELTADDIGEIFRIMHTIKGSAAMMGLQNMSKLAHSVEDLFYIIRENPETKYDKPAMYELLFAGSDGLKNEMDVITDDSAELTDFTELINKIHAFADVMKGTQQTAAAEVSQTDIFPDGEAENIQTFKVKFEESCLMPAIRAMVLLNSLGDCAEVCSTIPQDLNEDSAGDVITKNGLYIKLITDSTDSVLTVLKEGINVEAAEEVKRPEKKAEEKPAEPTPQPAEPEQKSAAPASAPKPAAPKESHSSSIISVRLEKLDRLLDLVAEIVITESGVTSSPDLKNFTGNLERFSKSARELKKLTDELQDVVMSIRMVPVQSAFSKMSRVVRDMNKKLGKNVELVFRGEDTEMDKSVVDILGDPLMHIVRNAVDHGIETPEERQRAGKTEPARVILSAGCDSSEVIISCEDNGAGMDSKKLLAKAKKNGILTKPENEYTEAECINLIMAAGFSTNEKVTEYSGRGVGMDVVRKNIEKVGGKVIVESELGKGSKFIIKIPLSLSIIDVLGIKAAETDFSIPISSVKEIFRAEDGQIIHDPDGSELIMLREKCLRVIRLSEAFELGGEKTALTDGIMLYCKDQGREAVLFGDELTSDQQVVVKPFSTLLARYNLKEKGLTGCSILADGSITLITDVNEIFKRSGIASEDEI